MAHKKVGLLIPCYQVEPYLPAVLKAIPSQVVERLEAIFIIDNQSSDNTLQAAEQTVRACGLPRVKIFKNRDNYSLGGSLILGFRMAREMGLDYLICMHSDGQANPKDLPAFFPYIDNHDDDFVLGSRLLKTSRVEEYSWLRRFVNLVFAYMQQVILRQRMYDIGCFIAYKIKTLDEIPYDRLVSDMGFPPYLILSARFFLKRKMRFHEFPISWGKIEISHVNPWLYGLIYLQRLVRIAVLGPRLRADSPALPTDLVYQS